jgi:hypothetical protein
MALIRAFSSRLTDPVTFARLAQHVHLSDLLNCSMPPAVTELTLHARDERASPDRHTLRPQRLTLPPCRLQPHPHPLHMGRSQARQLHTERIGQGLPIDDAVARALLLDLVIAPDLPTAPDA